MSTSVNPEKFMPKLLDLLRKAKAVAKEPEAVKGFESIENELQSMKEKDLLAKVKLFDQTMLQQFTSLERRLGKIILGAETTYKDIAEVKKALDLMFRDVGQIKDSIPLVEKMPSPERNPESQVRRTNASSTTVLVNKCTMHPWIRRMLISLASEARLFHFDSKFPRMPSYDLSACRRACLVFDNPIPKGEGDDLLTVFNVTEHYLNLNKEWLNKLKKVVVLQLGRWQDSATHHIEVEDEGFLAQEDGGFLKGLGAQNKHLKYLSLRGISKINRLPSSIVGLVSLEILDLRARHNLERMPSDISSLRKLTHLDLSECYLLEGMPKGIEKLSSLQVLKGFVIGSLKNTPCRLGDLAKLKSLKRLSIHMGYEAVVQEEEFKKLKDMSSLRRLKISWGVVSKKLKKTIVNESAAFLLPPDLEQLDLQGMPLSNVPGWLKPSQLQKLNKLYIRGGELVSLAHGETEGWTVKILSLKFLKNLKIESPSLKELFPHLQHLEVKLHGSGKDT